MGSDQVKGFAVTLILGIVMNLFTAIFVLRVFFDIAEKTRCIKDLKMLHILSHPNFDFIGKRRIAIAVSLIIIGIGMVAVVDRGRGLLDIDFTGGVSVQTLFKIPVEIAEVRKLIDDAREDLPDATVQDVRIANETPGKRFVINTSNPKIDDVEAKLGEIFKGQLVVNKIEVAKVDAISAAPAEAAPAKAEPAKEQASPGGGDGTAPLTAPRRRRNATGDGRPEVRRCRGKNLLPRHLLLKNQQKRSSGGRTCQGRSHARNHAADYASHSAGQVGRS